jgi:hypothetical protein
MFLPLGFVSALGCSYKGKHVYEQLYNPVISEMWHLRLD